MQKKNAFTLVELLVVIAVIGVLVSMLLPAVQAAREAARRMQCSNHLKQIGLALQMYHDATGTLPNGGNFSYRRGGTWASHILPYIEQQSTYDLFDFDLYIWDPVNENAVQTVISTYMCPSDGSGKGPLQGGRTNVGSFNPGESMGLWYLASMGPARDGGNTSCSCVYCSEPVGGYCCAGPSARFPTGFDASVSGAGIMGRYSTDGNTVTFRDITDGLSCTIAVGETIPCQCLFNGAYNHNFPIAGTTIPLNTFEGADDTGTEVWYRACGFKSYHPGGALFVMVDGSVHFFSESIDYYLCNALGSRAGGEAVEVPR